MKIDELGGEFELIKRVTREINDENVIYGVGDDAAVIEIKGGYYLLTTDMLCEGDHFSLDYFEPYQIGVKAMVSNLSDIAAMGGEPTYALVSNALNDRVEVETVDGIYEGIYSVAEEDDVKVIGGDMTHSNSIVLNIMILGKVSQENLVTRGSASPGDQIYASGFLGGATAGLELFLNKVKGFENVKKYHTEPSARFDISKEVSTYVSSMEDVSDGLASEVRNICDASQTGAVIFEDAIPIKEEVKEVAERLGISATNFALFGGEDFELVYTVPPDLDKNVPGYKVGEIIEERKIYLGKEGKGKQKLEKFGFDHFKAE